MDLQKKVFFHFFLRPKSENIVSLGLTQQYKKEKFDDHPVGNAYRKGKNTYLVKL